MAVASTIGEAREIAQSDMTRRMRELERGGAPLCPYQASFKKVWATTLRKAGVAYFRIYDLRSTYATRLSAGGVADEWVTQLLRQGDAKVFKKYSQMKLQMKREALEKLNRKANDKKSSDTGEAA